MKRIILIVNFLFSVLVFAQPGTIDLTFNSSDLGFGNGDGANYGILNAKVQNDGKIIIVGGFTSYNGTLINRIARINIDGSIDLSFNVGTGANGSISTTSIQSDGKIIIGGSFTSYNGTSINRIARLNNNGSLDLTFNPGSGPSGDPLGFSIDQSSIQIDGKIIIGGNFTSYNGTSRNRIARLNPDGSLDTTFNPGTGITTGSSIYSISLQSDGKIIIGGNFSSFNGISSKNIARLNINGTLDNTFNVGTGASSSIRSTYIQNDGKIIIGGGFTSYNGTASNYIARLNLDGSVDNTFNIGTGASGTVWACSIQSDGRIIISGDFTSYNANSVPKVARINPDGTLDNGFDTGGTGILDNAYVNQVKCISILNDGKILLTGNFTFVNGLFRNTIAFLDSNGLLTNINHGYGVQGGSVSIVKKYGSDKTIIAGNFYAYNGIKRRGLAMLNPDGSLDTTFNPGTGIGSSTVSDIEVVNDKIIITGNFTSYNGISANKIIRLNSDGSKDTSFNIGTGPNLGINTITSIGNNKFLIGGNFTSYNGTNINKIARINYDGSIDTSFNPQNIGSVGTINSIEIINNLSLDVYVAGGNFTCNGYNNTFLCSFLNNGGILTNLSVGQSGDMVNVVLYDGSKINYANNSSFYQTVNATNMSAYEFTLNGPIYTMSKQSDGKIIIGGDFTSFNGTSSNYLARLNKNGTLDNTFNIGTGANGIVRTTSIQSDGKIIIGGDFTSYNGTGRNRIARINGDNALSTNLLNKNTMVIYPNPSRGVYALKTNEMNAGKSICIYTILGQKVYDAVISSNETTIDISNQPKGVYLYKFFGENGETKSGKLVIE
jgi:uncharacterized delta-60 repeat protein